MSMKYTGVGGEFGITTLVLYSQPTASLETDTVSLYAIPFTWDITVLHVYMILHCWLVGWV